MRTLNSNQVQTDKLFYGYFIYPYLIECMLKKTILLVSLLISTNTFAWNLFGPKNFEECTSENLKGVSSNLAAKMIYSTCIEKFTNGDKEKKLNDCVLENLKGVANDLAAGLIIGNCTKKYRAPEVKTYNIPLASGETLQAPVGMSREEALASARAQGVDAVGIRDVPLLNGGTLHVPDNMSDEEAVAEASKADPSIDFTLANKK